MDALAGLAGGLAQEGFALVNMDKQARINEQQMQRAYELNQSAQQHSPLNTIAGIRGAGLNPAMLNGGSFSSPSVSPLGVTGQSAPNFMQLAQLNTQQRLLEEQINKTAQESEFQELINKRAKSEDFTLDSNLRGLFENLAKENPDKADVYNKLAKSVELYDKGTLDAMSEFDKYVMQISDQKLRIQLNDFESKMKKYQSDNEIWKTLAEVPEREKSKFFADLTKLAAETSKLYQSGMSDAKSIELMAAQIQKMAVEMDATYHTDLAGMIKNGDYFLASVKFFGDLAGSFAGGAGLGAGSAVGRTVGSADRAAGRAARSPGLPTE